MTLNHRAVPMLYKGAGPGTHWHLHDARLSGFSPPGTVQHTLHGVVNHITAYPQHSSYLSFTTSFDVACAYAETGPAGVASASNPGYVYHIDLQQLLTAPNLLDPLQEISMNFNGGLAHSHNGGVGLIAEVARDRPPVSIYTQARQSGGGFAHPSVSRELQALIRAIRDAELLVNGGVPGAAVVLRTKLP